MEKITGGTPDTGFKQVFACFHGFAGEGKTSQLLSFPSPLWFLNCGDRDAKHLIAKLPSHYEVNYEWLIQDADAMSQKIAESYLLRANAMLNAAIREGKGSFLIDASDIFWDYVQSGKITAPEGTALRFKDANGFLFNFYQRLTNSKLQVGITSMAQEIWNGPKATGRYSHGGWKHIDRYIKTDVRMFIKEELTAGEKPMTTANPTVTHAAYIEAAKDAEHMARRIFDNPSFAFIYRATFGEAYPEEEKLWRPC